MKRHHGEIIPPIEFEDRGQFHAREGLENEEQVIFVNVAVLKVMFTIYAWKQHQAVGPDLFPKGFGVHWLQPFYNIVDVFEFHSRTSLPDCSTRSQICAPVRGVL